MLRDVRVLRFYTEEPEPSKTNTAIKFVLEYHNTGSTRVSSVPAKIHLGTRQVKNVTLPGIDPGKINRISLVLTNNITEELGKIGVSISDSLSASIDWSKLLNWNWHDGLNLGFHATLKGREDFSAIGQMPRPVGKAQLRQLVCNVSQIYNDEINISNSALALCAVTVVAIISILTGAVELAAGVGTIIGGLAKVLEALEAVPVFEF